MSSILDAIEEVESGARRLCEAGGWTSIEGAPPWVSEACMSSWASILSASKHPDSTLAEKERLMGAIVHALREARTDPTTARTMQAVVGLGGGRKLVEWAVACYGGER